MARHPPQPDVKRPSGESLRRALAFVKARLEALESVPREPPFNDEYTVWARVTSAGLKEYFGEDSDESGWVDAQPLHVNPFYTAAQQAASDRKRWAEVLQSMRTGLETILAKHEALGPATKDNVGVMKGPARAFISHGGDKRSLTLVQDFLRALGVEPIVVEKRASEGREVHENVDAYRKRSDFAVILWTKDSEDAQGTWHPSGSVEIEVGELRTQFGGRVIYLKEEGVTLPAMASTLVHEPFTEHNMGPAYLKIVTELHGWEWLTVSPPEADQ